LLTKARDDEAERTKDWYEIIGTVLHTLSKASSTFNDGDIHQKRMILSTLGSNPVLTDGILTIGVNAGQGSHVFFNDVRIILTGAADVDYASLYEALPEMPTAIETLEGTPAAKVRAIEMFDLNGRRVTKAQKGLVIMKQIMSDGSIRTIKVVK
jgi:hypothetical protein